jgi:hypothetical protein
MIKRILFALVLTAYAAAQTPTVVRTNTGNLKCGALKRSATTVQTYCYAVAPDLVLVHNTIDTIRPGKVLEVRFNDEANAVVWYFTLDTGQVRYVLMTGTLEADTLARMVDEATRHLPTEADPAEWVYVGIGMTISTTGDTVATYTAGQRGVLL